LTPYSLVIVVYDEAESVDPLLEEVHACLEGQLPAELLVVDDGSTDGTGERLRAAAERLPLPVRVLRHHRNFGQSAALRTGVLCARSNWVVTLDGDGQNDPADIPRLLALLGCSGAESKLRLVCGDRQQRQDPWGKRVSSRIANAARNAVLRDGVPDTGCGLKLIERRAFLDLPLFDHMHRFLPALIRRNGGEVVSIPVHHRPRKSGRSKYGLHDRLWVGIADLCGVWWLMRRAQNPTFDVVLSK
jgi:dolichol-phosphate mannosyltransferase